MHTCIMRIDSVICNKITKKVMTSSDFAETIAFDGSFLNQILLREDFLIFTKHSSSFMRPICFTCSSSRELCQTEHQVAPQSTWPRVGTQQDYSKYMIIGR